MQFSFAHPRSALALALFLTGMNATSLSAAPRTSNTVAQLDATEAASLTFIREEEKLARDVYAYLFPLWNTTLFSNISGSEQQHFEAVGKLLDRYRLDDPALQDLPGSFQNTELQALYDTLVERGSESNLAALQVGALIEEMDIIDLAKAIADTDQTDIIQVYDSLLRGSRNHLRAFVGAIEAEGVPYSAQVLSQEQLDAIVDEPMERGRR